jgi:predicted nucleic acid-binding protein
MALEFLADTSVLTRLREPAVHAALQLPVEQGAVARAGITDLELGHSARDAAEWDGMIETLRAFELVETTADHVRRARQV